ncbi:MAG: hypothetical protein ACOH2F_03705 [Cellulomonas sp.]
MPTRVSARQETQRSLDIRQKLADEAVAALAHGQRRADTLYTQLTDLEGQIEHDHPQLVARNFGTWATHDADQLALHQSAMAPDCTHCEAASSNATHPIHALTA